MAVDPNPSHRPNSYKPARDMDDDLPNMSRPESGGQVMEPGACDATPSMATDRRGTKSNADVWNGPTDTTPGSPPSD